jgi:hypothetical protein
MNASAALATAKGNVELCFACELNARPRQGSFTLQIDLADAKDRDSTAASRQSIDRHKNKRINRLLATDKAIDSTCLMR